MKGLHPTITDELKDITKISEEKLNELWDWGVSEAKEWREFLEIISGERSRRKMEAQKDDFIKCGVWERREFYNYLLEELKCSVNEYCLIDVYMGARGYHSNLEPSDDDGWCVVMRDREGRRVVTSKTYKNSGSASSAYAPVATRVKKDILKKMRKGDIATIPNCEYCLGTNGSKVTCDQLWLEIHCPVCENRV